MSEKDFYYAEYMNQPDKQSAAFQLALKNRESEIDLYWRRTTYFWTLSAAVLAGYFGLTSIKTPATVSPNAALGVACFGFIISLAWFFVNKGSKYWQENWENHVVSLANPEVGSLFQKIMHRPATAPKNKTLAHIVYFFRPTEPKPISVTKINQWVSLYTVIIWAVIIVQGYPAMQHLWRSFSPECQYLAIGLPTLLFAIIMRVTSRTNLKGHTPAVFFNASRISN